ncbi:chemotaxis protein CheB [Atopomonas sediminilitoris]|uniref:chemotaxis protein CheB n=1 Tax=Atopomonas sediminilitoris TaxID=2919919 RepID=UPI001F4EC1C5|nr:chemotaxis protein CheB [Atopomonas sediminilitoris]MCJ8168241.1 chemotaxis protein CheB [Atopomonas sediminilitoris]
MANTAMSARIAVIADTSLQRHVLQQALAANGYEVVLNTDPARFDEVQLQQCQPDLWLVDLVKDDDRLIDLLLEHSETPVLFGEGQAPQRNSEHYPRWERRLFGKLKRLVGDPTRQVGPALNELLDSNKSVERIDLPAHLHASGEQVQEVWLLAASLGGPAAVKNFLDALPHGLPVAFIYAQHIDPSFETRLPQAVGRHSQWPVRNAVAGQPLRAGEVVVASIEQEMSFADDGGLLLCDRPWPEPYSPSIDQMMLNLAQHFAGRCGVMVFSGMGCDGLSAAAYVERQGGEIWTQTADTCACPSMPESLREAGHSRFNGTPHELAAALVARLAAHAAA